MSLELPEGQKLPSLLVQGAPVSDPPSWGEAQNAPISIYTLYPVLPPTACLFKEAHLADDLLGAGVSSLQPSPL